MKKIRLSAMLLALVLVLTGLMSPSASATPTLTGVLLSAPTTSVDLTTEGRLDWAHWGLASAASFDHKATVPSQITNFTAPGPVAQVSPVGVTYKWSDGIPTPAAITDSGVVARGVGNSFTIKVPADTTLKTLKLYVGVRSAQGKLHVWLSDGSAIDYWDSTLNSTGVLNGVYKISFAAASAGQMLYVNWSVVADYGTVQNSGVTLQSATLY